MATLHPQAFAQAVQLHQAGQFAQAEALYRQILSAQPNHSDALHMLAVLAHQFGKNDVATDLLRKAVTSNPRIAIYQCNLGLVLNAQERYAEAAPFLETAVRLDPNLAEAHNNLAIALWHIGQQDRAIAAWQTAIRIKPNMAEAYSSLGNVLRKLDRFDEARQSLQTAIRINPSLPDSHANLGVLLKQIGQPDAAIASMQTAVRLRPDRADLHDKLATVLFTRGRMSDAELAYRNAVRLAPGVAVYHCHLGSALWASARPDEAAASIRTAIQLDPNSPEAHASLGNVLKDQAQLTEAVAAYRKAVEINPNDHAVYSSLIYLLHFLPGEGFQPIGAELSKWSARFADPLKSAHPVYANDRNPDRPLRIGYVSPDLRGHAVGRFMLPLLRLHNRSAVEVFCYSDTEIPDATTTLLESSSHHWRHTAGLSDASVAQLIRQDQIDILIDLAAHTPDNRLLLFARKPAPLQVTYLSYPSTTGLAMMDYRVTDLHLDPPGASDPGYSEESIHLPATYWCYEAPEAALPVDSLPAIANGYVTFGCLNTLRKVSSEALISWAAILRAVPGSKLLMFANPGSVRDLFRQILAKEGVDPSRIEFVGYAGLADYFQTYSRIDIALDPFPYTGGTTTCDALWMGVPTISLAGQLAVHRGGVSILQNVGLSNLIADSKDQYIQIATALASDLIALTKLRISLRERMKSSPLMDSKRFAADMETLFRTIWKRWCSKQTT